MSNQSQFVSGLAYKQLRMNDNSDSSKSLVQHHSSRDKICANLHAGLPDTPDMAQITAKKVYFEFVDLGALKLIITVKFERKAFQFSLDNPSFGFGNIIYTLLTTVATISESPITFKEIILMHTFTS